MVRKGCLPLDLLSTDLTFRPIRASPQTARLKDNDLLISSVWESDQAC
jgi:hypothetical protein